MTGATLVIAEAGVNHNGDIEQAKKLIEVAAQAGADLVKFQSFRAADLATSQAQMAEYQKAATGEQYSQLDMLQRLELSVEDHKVLIAHCKQEGIGFFSTAFDEVSIELLRSLGQELFKVPSGELTNLPFLRRIGGLGKRVILSSGMATLDELVEAVEVLEHSGTQRDAITVLHCTSQYPAPINEVNLRAMNTIQKTLRVAVGYSDHTLGMEVALAAVAMGARIIEKHITLDREMAGPDHKASMEPGEFMEMVRLIRNIEKALGDGIKAPAASELNSREVARRSLVASCAIAKGELFTAENLTTKRPGTGISPMLWDEVIGTKAPRDFAEDELIEL